MACGRRASKVSVAPGDGVDNTGEELDEEELVLPGPLGSGDGDGELDVGDESSN